MLSSKRSNLVLPEGETPSLALPAERDLRAYVIFTRLTSSGPLLYAGWLDAADDAMALDFARDHYGRDQVCVEIWAVDGANLIGTDLPGSGATSPPTEAAQTKPAGTAWQAFRRAKAGEIHRAAEVVTAPDAEEAMALLRRADSSQSIWIAQTTAIIRTAPGEAIWPLTDQSYRLARGYSRSVRDKWTRFQSEEHLRSYERDDLREEF